MIRSMTGFGEASSDVDGVHYFLEVRSLNGKYFKSTIRLPEELQGLEPVLVAELRRRLTRGTVTAIGRCSDTRQDAAYRINQGVLEHYLAQLDRPMQNSNGSFQVNVADLLGLPGVLQPPSNEEERNAHAQAAFVVLVAEACERLMTMRNSEGTLLESDLMVHHEVIAERLQSIAGRAPLVIDEYQQRLHTRIETLLAQAQVAVEPADLIREVAVYADKSDISEEIARLSGHLDQFKSILNTTEGKPVGRTLDFLTQEMLREANTIASKSSDGDISRDTVEIKGAIDRIKEQVQNVV